MYQVPALIKHPFSLPLVYAFRYPFPEKTPVLVEVAPEVVVVPLDVVVTREDVTETGLPDFGRYLIPDDEQDPLWPTGAIGTKVPVCTEPRTSKEYQTSSRAPSLHWIVTS